MINNVLETISHLLKIGKLTIDDLLTVSIFCEDVANELDTGEQVYDTPEKEYNTHSFRVQHDEVEGYKK